LLLKAERPAEAEAEAREGTTQQPQLPEAHAALGAALARLGKPMAAIRCLHRALELRPDYSDAAIRCAQLLGDLGRQESSDDLLRSLVRRNGEDGALRSSLLYGLHHTLGDNGLLLLNEHVAWSTRHADPLCASTERHANDPDPDRRLRVGYVSADFRDHPTSRFLVPLITAHDRSQVEVYCYSDTDRNDELTHEARAVADVWRDTIGLRDEDLAARARKDQIDILVDPTGHMADGRLLTFARKPAPVQISYFGYPGTVAIRTVEYRITDDLLDPIGTTEHHYTEQLLRIAPSCMAFAPITAAPDVGPLPAVRNDYITFGAVNRLSKATPFIVGLWARILATVPRSRLMILAPLISEPEADEEIRRYFSRHGVPPDRLVIVPRCPREVYLDLFNQIDVHLDSFPYHGCTTTCDALWMGVPTITLAGQAYASRMGVSLLTQVDLRDFIAQLPQDYVEIAARVVADLSRLRELRSSLRMRMRTSPLMDYSRLAHNIEGAFRIAWARWCDAQTR
jgi:predicted O-linked N-acetylglucosamine transferase (SPINDLY family)